MITFLLKKKLLLGIFVLYLTVSTYTLETLPGEWFGDISNLHGYVLDIQQGRWPVTFRQGVGPLVHYLYILFIPLTGQRYIGYKMLSVLSGAFSLLGVYFFAKNAFDKRTALLTTAITAVSFWFLVWARLGNVLAILPGLVAFSFSYLFLYRKTQKRSHLIAGLLFAGASMFVYLGGMAVPVAFLVTFLLTQKKKNCRDTGIAVAGILMILGLFIWVQFQDRAQLLTNQGYIGEKYLSIFSMEWHIFLKRIPVYIWKLMLMLHVRGDQIFRINVPGSPMLDVVSGLLFFVGVITVVLKNKGSLIFVAPLLIVLPSIFPSLLPQQIPSSTRTFAATPFIFLIIGVGLSRLGKLGKLSTLGILGIVCVLNMYKYFYLYPQTLPNHNVAYGAIIASYIDTLPKTTKVYLSGCCWGDWGQPDPQGIYYQLKHPEGKQDILGKLVTSCDEPEMRRPSLIIMPPQLGSLSLSCPHGSVRKIEKQGQHVATVMELN